MTPLKKGNPCRVRLHTGEVVEAVYDERSTSNHHFVEVNGKLFITCAKPTSDSLCGIGDCRLVGPACDHVDIVPMGVSV